MTFDPHIIRKRLQDPDRRNQALAEVAEWVKDTCLICGANPATAFRVAAVFIEGLDRDVPRGAKDER